MKTDVRPVATENRICTVAGCGRPTKRAWYTTSAYQTCTLGHVTLTPEQIAEDQR